MKCTVGERGEPRPVQSETLTQAAISTGMSRKSPRMMRTGAVNSQPERAWPLLTAECFRRLADAAFVVVAAVMSPLPFSSSVCCRYLSSASRFFWVDERIVFGSPVASLATCELKSVTTSETPLADGVFCAYLAASRNAARAGNCFFHSLAADWIEGITPKAFEKASWSLLLVSFFTRSTAPLLLALSAAMPQQLVNCRVPAPAGPLGSGTTLYFTSG